MSDHSLDAIPSIREALNQETIPDTKLNIGFALAKVGDDLGLAALQNACADNNSDMALRLKSINYSLQAGWEFCIDTIKTALRPEREDVVNHVRALSLVPSFRNLPEADSQEITKLVVGDLGSKDAVVRLRASQALGHWGKVSTASEIQRALSHETSEPTRTRMQRDLSLLLDEQKTNPK